MSKKEGSGKPGVVSALGNATASVVGAIGKTVGVLGGAMKRGQRAK